MKFDGSCHCGAIRFVYRTAISPVQWSVRACQCSFCRAHDALTTSDPDGELEFTFDSAGHLQRYRFGLRTADFLLCTRCGVYIGAVIETDNRFFGIINTHALKHAPPDLAAAERISYDGEDTTSRVSRREQRWTPVSLSVG